MKSAQSRGWGRNLRKLLAVAVVATAIPSLGASAADAVGPVSYSATPLATKPWTPCPPATATTAECGVIVAPRPSVITGVTSGEFGGELGDLSPAELRSAYGLSGKGGAGVTVAIVDGDDDPDAEADLGVYRSHYGLPACTTAGGCFRKVNSRGEARNYPPGEWKWGVEISLDLDMVSASCPECHILLVEADNSEPLSLAKADEEAVSLGAAVVSNSWDFGFESEYGSTELGYDHYFDHPGVPILFSAGDYGYGIRAPADSPYVIAVGGTTLTRSANSRGWSEEVWSNPSAGLRQKGRGTSSGCSRYEPKPVWQTDSACAGRMDDDVAADADWSKSPVSIYDSYQMPGWDGNGGTSASAPFVAGVEAISSAATRAAGPEAFYLAAERGGLFDVTSGNNGSCTPPAQDGYWCTAGPGYDGPTGLGSPDGPINGAPPPLESTGAPRIFPATPIQGLAATTTNGTWSRQPASFSYQWQRCSASGGECSNLGGATTATYTPGEADVGHALRVKVTATRSGLEGLAFSEASGPVRKVGEIAEFPIPESAYPSSITTGPDGNLWVSELGGGKVFKLTSAGVRSGEYSLPSGSGSEGITAGPDGNLWAAEKSKPFVARITPAGLVTEYPVPSGTASIEIATGGDGALWFTGMSGGFIGRVTTAGAMREFPLRLYSRPREIATDLEGNIWFTNQIVGAEPVIGKITPAGVITEYPVEAPGGLNGLARGPEGYIWFGLSSAPLIGRITPFSGAVHYFPLPAGATANHLATGPDGNLWYTDPTAARIGRITPSGVVTEYPLPAGSYPWSITAGPDGRMWFTESHTATVGAIAP